MVGRIEHVGAPLPQKRVVIGPGKPDGKTQGIIDIAELAGKSGIYVPEYACITPQFFRRFLEHSGALKATSYEQASNLIYSHKFTGKEMDALKDAVFLFEPHKYGYILQVRSGDQPQGLGIWGGGQAVARIGDVKSLLELVADTAKGILASDFLDDALEYKKIKGISGNPGVIVMPSYGECFNYRGAKI